MTRCVALSIQASHSDSQKTQESGKVLINDVPIPEPLAGQMLVKIRAASLCHSDLMMSQRPDGLGPLTIGHEGVGTVASIHPSSEAQGFKVGDRVGMLAIIDTCFDCEGCRVHGSFCVNSSRGGPKIQGLQAHGCFAEYMVTDCASAIHLPGDLPMDRMSPLFCAGITAFHAVDKCRLEAGQWLAIVGCGGLGQLAIRYAKAMGKSIFPTVKSALNEC
jgi:D-arabinose 1-dehydrogenase-like Zn-dependent alcohol dehydrogenase